MKLTQASILPATSETIRRAAELQNVVLADPEMLQQLPRRMGLPGGADAHLIRRHVFHRFRKRRVRVPAPQGCNQLIPKLSISLQALYAPDASLAQIQWIER